MPIKVTYSDNTKIHYNSFDEIINNDNVIEINCSNNNLTSLPDNMIFSNLTHFYCSNNKLTSLPPNMILPNLTYFNCSYNNLYYIPLHLNCCIHKDYNTKSPEYMRRKLLI